MDEVVDIFNKVLIDKGEKRTKCGDVLVLPSNVKSVVDVILVHEEDEGCGNVGGYKQEVSVEHRFDESKENEDLTNFF